ncbi:MAG: ABC transporter permease [Polyangiaceae bacterium]
MISVSATIALKDLRLLSRDRMALFWVVGFPLFFALFFGSVMKANVEMTTAPIPLVVVDDPDAAPHVAMLAASLERSGMRVTRASPEAARAAVRRGDAVAFVRLPKGPGPGPIELGIDPSRRTEAALLHSLLSTPVEPASRRAVDTVDVVREASEPENGFDIAFPAMILWGLIGCSATFAVGMVAERSSGTLLRLRAAPISRAAILGGKAMACVVACGADSALLSVFGRAALHIPIRQPVEYAAAIACTVICFSGLTIMLSVLGKSDQAVAGAGWAAMIVLAMVGGAMVPLSIMPAWLLTLSDFSPVKWGIVALEGATWRGLSWSELSRPLFLLLAVGAAGFASGVAVVWSWREA